MEIPLIVSDVTLKHVFYVVPRLSRSLILGVDFLRSTKSSIKFHNLNQDILTIRASENISVAPNAESYVCAVVVSHESMHKTIGVTENLRRCTNVPYCVKRGVVTPAKGTNEVPIMVFNSSDKNYQIKKGSIIGLYSLRVEEDFMGPDDLKEEPIDSHDCDYTIDENGLGVDQKAELRKLLDKNRDTFIIKDTELTTTTEYTHRIDLKREYTPVNIMAYRTSPGRKEIMENLLKGQEEAGVIERCPGHTEWCSPAFLVEKGKAVNGKRSFRIVVDFRHLNQQIKNQAYNFPRIDDTLNKVGNLKAKYFSTLDAYSGFFQIPLRERDRNLTAFATPGKTWRYRTMPMGLSTSPKAFHNVIANVVQHLPSCLPYVDDIIVASPTWESHMTDLDGLFKAFRNANIKFKKAKCSFGFKTIPFLGFVVSEHGIHPNPNKVKLIREFPIPKTPKHVKSFNGLATYYQSFIPHFAATMQPLYDLTKRNIKFEWKEEHQQAFDKIRKSIADDAVLKYPDFGKPFTIATDSSKFAVGCCISQFDKDGNLRPVAFAGRKLSKAERNYSVTDQELVGIKFALIKFEHYVIGRRFEILTDHAALIALGGKVKLTGRMAKWADFFARFDFEIKHLKGKLNVVPDALSRIPTFEDIGDDDVRKKFKNTRFNSVHAIKFFEKHDYLENYPIRIYRQKSIMTKAESVNAITRAQTKRLQQEEKDSDDPPLVDQTDSFNDPVQSKQTVKFKQSKRPMVTSSKAKKRRIKAIVSLSKEFREPIFRDVLSIYRTPFTFQDLVAAQKNDEFCAGFINYINHDSLPEDNRLARNILLTHDQYFLHDDILYRYTGKLDTEHTLEPQLVLPIAWTSKILHNLHDGPLGAHVGITKLTSVIKPRFYWQTMNLDIYNHVNTCHKCLASKYVKNPLTLPMTLHE